MMAGCMRGRNQTVMLFHRRHWHLLPCSLSALHRASSPAISQNIVSYPHKQTGWMFFTSRMTKTRISSSDLTEPRDCSTLCRQSASHSNPVELLDLIDSELLQRWPPNDTASYLVQVGHCQMQSLRVSLPWLEASYHTGYRQLVMAGQLELVNKAIRKHEKFVDLCRSLEQSYEECDSPCLTNSLLMLLYLGINPTERLVHKLLFEVRHRIPAMDVREVSVVARAYATMPTMDVITGRLVTSHVSKLINQQRSWSSEDFSSLCVTVSKMIRLMSADSLLSFFKVVMELTKCPGYLTDPKHIENLSMALIKMPGHVMVNKSEMITVVTQLKQAMIQNLNSMEHRGLHSVSNAVQYVQWQYHDDFRIKCEERALAMLNDSCSVREIINLLTVCNSKTERSILAVFEDKLRDKIDEMDGHLVGYTARCFNKINPYHISKSTLYKLQSTAADLGHHFVDYSGMMVRSIASLFMRRSVVQPDVHDRLNSSFLRYLNSMEHDYRYVSSILLYLMLMPDCPGLPDAIFEKMMQAVGKWNMGHVSHTMYRLNTLTSKPSPRCQMQIEMLQVVFQMRFLELLPKVTSVNELCSVARRVICTDHSPAILDTAVITAILEKYQELSSQDVDESTLNEVILLFTQLKYYLPSLFDDMVTTANHMEINEKKQTYPRLLKLLGKVGYKPKDFTKFTINVLESWEECCKENHYRTMLFILHYLSRLQYFPEQELKHVFSMDFLQTIDKDIKKGRTKVRDELMTLNRACVLECPELGIPWFHEQYCRRNVKGVKNALSKLIKPALECVLGGEKHFSSCVFSPFYYLLDFETVLDENQHPINKAITDYGVNENWQRVAILVHTEQRYCLHSHQLDGFSQVKLRHLKLLGYKVVEIPYYEWKSIGIADFDGQCDYLYKKIFT